jgi:hypothetical protein
MTDGVFINSRARMEGISMRAPGHIQIQGDPSESIMELNIISSMKPSKRTRQTFVIYQNRFEPLETSCKYIYSFLSESV